MSRLLAGKRALVTGAGTGIGAATARRFAAEGAALILFGPANDALNALAAELGATAVPGDVTRDGDVAAAMRAAAEGGGLDIAVNAAGIMVEDDVGTIVGDNWDRILAVNLTGTMMVCRAAIPLLTARPGGAVVNLASVAAFNATEGSASYAASKAGVVALTRSMANKYGARGLRANCVCPGWTRTPMSESEMDVLARQNGTSREAEFETLTRRIALRRVAAASEIAACVTFLASDEASFVTGAVLVADGGGRAAATARAT